MADICLSECACLGGHLSAGSALTRLPLQNMQHTYQGIILTNLDHAFAAVLAQ